MHQPFGPFSQNQILPPRHVRGLLAQLNPLLTSVGDADARHLPEAMRFAGAVLGGYLSGRGYPPEQAAAWVNQWLQASHANGARPNKRDSSTQPAQQSGVLVQSAEANDTLRSLLTSSIDDEATAAAFYANIAEALQEAGLDQASIWVREAGRDEEKHRTLLQRRYRELYGTTHQPMVGKTSVEDLATALTEALSDEFTDSRKYRDAYLALPDPTDQKLFFELATDEMRHSTVFTYALQALR